ncbi:hypothetical protein [Plantibacter sp. LMC-P-059a]|uniref:hypothetical protein n=1 Tax=Plantibacter sp. LMC-P-059a TaxID=3040297 RepID=UPI0025512BC5|nr:hypothetical protein [Plantibacter sp. LMC-P-059a]
MAAQLTSPQAIEVSLDGALHDASLSWRCVGHLDYVVNLSSAAFEPIEVHAEDAFEALCLIRETLEPQGWRIGVAGAQPGVWPSGMARDQGGGLVAYRLTAAGVGGTVPTFEPVDPATVTTVRAQQAEAQRRLGGSVRHQPAAG